MRERELPLRERAPEYCAVFAVGLAAAGAVGLLIAAFTESAAATAVGYSMMLLGVLMLFAGGGAGGGYASLGLGEGALRRTFLQGTASQQRRHHDTGTDPVDRIRRGMRPQANPAAFWQVVGGALYIGVGLVLVALA